MHSRQHLMWLLEVIREVNAKLHNQQQRLTEKERELHAASSEKQQLENDLINKLTTLDDLRAKMAISVENTEQLTLKYEGIKEDHDKVIASKLLALQEIEHLNKNNEHKATCLQYT